MSGIKPIQVALALESLMNIYGAAQIYLDPSNMLSSILPPGTAHSAVLKTNTYWVANLTLGITPAFLMCIPNSGPHQTAARRTLYTTFIGFEALMAGVTALQLYSDDAGITLESMYAIVAMFSGFTLLRIVFLFIRPDWMDGTPSRPAKRKQ